MPDKEFDGGKEWMIAVPELGVVVSVASSNHMIIATDSDESKSVIFSDIDIANVCARQLRSSYASLGVTTVKVVIMERTITVIRGEWRPTK